MRGLFVLVLCAGIAGSAKAEPGPVVNWLINEPASVFDVGMLRMQQLVRALEPPKELDELFTLVAYDWEENRIYIRGSIAKHNSINLLDPKQQVRALCGAFFDEIRKQAIVNPVTGQAIFDHSSYSAQFAHIGYSSNSAPKNYRVKLDRIIVIEFKYPLGLEGVRPSVCTGPLLDTGFSIKEEAAG